MFHIHTCTFVTISSYFSGYISKRNLAFNLTTIKELIVEAMQSITPKHWSDCIDHVNGIEVNYWASDIARDEMPDLVVIDFDSDDDTLTDTASEIEDEI